MFLNLVEKILTQETQQTPRRTDNDTHTRHIIVKSLKTKDKQKIFIALEERGKYIEGNVF